MSENNISGKVKEIMAALFSVEPSAINDESSPQTIEQWDSLKHINLIVALEEEFKITFGDDQISEMLDFKKIVDAINLQKK